MCATATFSARMVATVSTASACAHPDTRALTVKKVSINKQQVHFSNPKMAENIFLFSVVFMYNEERIQYVFSPYTLLQTHTFSLTPHTLQRPLQVNPVQLAELSLNDYMCLTPSLSWLYPAHTGQVSSFPEARKSLEASEANGTVSQ